LSFLHLNCQGISTSCKINQFEMLLDRQKPDFICINEHWIADFEFSRLHFPGYKSINFFARKKHERGGSAIFVHKTIDSRAIKLSSQELHFEISGAEVKLGAQKLIIISIYRPSNPKSNSKIDNFFNKLNKALEKITLKFGFSVKYLVAGDFNINLLDSSTDSQRLLNLFKNYGMSILNDQPTRIIGPKGTLIDHIYSNLSDIRVETKNVLFSDHEVLIAELPFLFLKNSNQKIYSYGRSFSSQNIQNFQHFLSLQSWLNVLESDDVNIKYSAFMETFLAYFNGSFPVHKKCFNPKKPFCLPDYLKEESERIKMFSRYINTNPNPSEKDKEYLKSWKSYHGWKIHQFKAELNSSKLEKSGNKIKTSWDIVNSTLDPNKEYQRNLPPLKINNEPLSDPLDIANALNEHFVVKPREVQNFPNLSHININPVSFFLAPTSPCEVAETISSLNNSNAAGTDEIPCNILKNVRGYIALPLSDIINASFEQGAYPELMKEAKINPLFKKGEVSERDNYRPISILPAFSKVIGKIFSQRLISFFEQNSLIYKHQHGFVKNRGTSTALFELVSNMCDALESGQKCMGIFYDFSKAFDSISHKILFAKLERYGVRGKPLDWIKSFLSNRTQKVVLKYQEGNTIKTVMSDTKLNEMGIGQGSILGPNIFNIFINDLALLITFAFILLYADDSNALVKSQSTSELYRQGKMNNLVFETWARENLLRLNSSKTQILQLKKKNDKILSSPLIKLDGNFLCSTESTKFLGAHLDQDLSYRTHCDNLNRDLSTCPFMFVILRKSVNKLHILRSVYFAHVQSHLQYGIICWGNSILAASVFITQKKIIRALLGFRYKRSNLALSSCKNLFTKLEILTVPSLFILECAKFFRKYPHYFIVNVHDHDHDTRRKADISKTNTWPSPYNNVADVYNKLPREIKDFKSYELFVIKLKDFLLKKCYYCVNDYFGEIWQS
jgi:exonuclease III